MTSLEAVLLVVLIVHAAAAAYALRHVTRERDDARQDRWNLYQLAVGGNHFREPYGKWTWMALHARRVREGRPVTSPVECDHEWVDITNLDSQARVEFCVECGDRRVTPWDGTAVKREGR